MMTNQGWPKVMVRRPRPVKKQLLRGVKIVFQSSAGLPITYCLFIPFVNLGFLSFSKAVSIVCHFKAMMAEES